MFDFYLFAWKVLGGTTFALRTDGWISSDKHSNRCSLTERLFEQVQPSFSMSSIPHPISYGPPTQLPIIAVTATATKEVRQDIVAKLQLRRPEILQQSFFRQNLVYSVRLDIGDKNFVRLWRNVHMRLPESSFSGGEHCLLLRMCFWMTFK